MQRHAPKTLFVVAHADADIPSLLDGLVADGTISEWDDSSPVLLRNSMTGEAVGTCPLSGLSLAPDEEEAGKAQHFWDGAIGQDGSIPPAILRVMRIDDGRRKAYVRRYKTCERYVEETSSVHADAVLLPDGSFSSNDGLRGPNQLHDWNVGFADRFLRPLAEGGTDGTEGGDAGRCLVVHAITYKMAGS